MSENNLATAHEATPSIEIPATPPQPDEGLWSSLLVTAAALAFVLALAWLLLRLLNRATAQRSRQGKAPLHVARAISLGGRERVIILRDGSLEYVLGVTATQVALIDKRQTLQPDSTDHTT